MNFLETYLETLNLEEEKSKARLFANNFCAENIKDFDYRSCHTTIFASETRKEQLFEIIASCADYDFEIFLVLTKNRDEKQSEYLDYALAHFKNFCVCGENDEIQFMTNKMRKPLLIVLKENTFVLKRWRNELLNCGLLSERPLLVAETCNIHKNVDSRTNKYINDIKLCSNSCIHICG